MSFNSLVRDLLPYRHFTSLEIVLPEDDGPIVVRGELRSDLGTLTAKREVDRATLAIGRANVLGLVQEEIMRELIVGKRQQVEAYNAALKARQG